MKIPTRIHGILDDPVGGVLILLGASLYGTTTPGVVLIAMGAATIVYSLLTNYELGAIKLIPMTGHLAIDFLGGIAPASSPWLFRFADTTWVPRVLMGLGELGVVLMSSRTPTSRASVRTG